MLKLLALVIFACSSSFTYGGELFPISNSRKISNVVQKVSLEGFPPIKFYGGLYTELSIMRTQGVVILHQKDVAIDEVDYDTFPNPLYPKVPGGIETKDQPFIAVFYEKELSKEGAQLGLANYTFTYNISGNQDYMKLAETMVNETFGSRIPDSLVLVSWRQQKCKDCPKNTFQLALGWNTFGDTYAIFNYENIQNANSNNNKVGFNSGNGTEWESAITNVDFEELDSTNGSAIQGRYVYKVDGLPKRGGCAATNKVYNLTINQTEVSLLGGELIALRGPCLSANTAETFTCEFTNEKVHNYKKITNAKVIFISSSSSPYLQCPTPKYLNPVGNTYVTLRSSNSNSPSITQATTPLASIIVSKTYTPEVKVNQADKLYKPGYSNQHSIQIAWDKSAITKSKVQVQVLGYEEDATSEASLKVLAEKDVENTGIFDLSSTTIPCKELKVCSTYLFGVISVSELGEEDSKILWTSIIPLNWLSGNHLKNLWADELCDKWTRDTAPTTQWSVQCPCTLKQVSADFARFKKIDQCTLLPNGECSTTQQCYTSTFSNSNNQYATCCYKLSETSNATLEFYEDHFSSQNLSHSSFTSISSFDDDTYSEFSFWKKEGINKFLCCKWNSNPARCSSYLERRPTPQCNNYKPTELAITLGDPHFITFDWKTNYTFNARGEFILLKTLDESISIQGRFEKILNHETHDQIEDGEVTGLAALAFKVNGATYELEVTPYAHIKNGNYFILRKDKIIQRFGIQDENVNIIAEKRANEQSNSTLVYIYIKLTNDRFIGLKVTVYKMNYMDATVSISGNMRHETYGLWGHLSTNPSESGLFVPDSSSGNRYSVANIEIYNQPAMYNDFGKKWSVPKEQSAFFYHLNLQYEYFNEDIKPIFPPENCSPDTDDDCADPSASFVNFDTDFSIPEIADATNKSLVTFVFLQNNLEKENFCGRPNIPNANFSTNQYSEGSVADVLNCGDLRYYKLSKATTLTCSKVNDAYSWTPTPNVNLCLYVGPVQEFKKPIAMAAIVVPIVVVLLILVVIIVVVVVLKRKKRGSASRSGSGRTKKPIVKSNAPPEYLETGKEEKYNEKKPMKFDAKTEELRPASDDDDVERNAASVQVKPKPPKPKQNIRSASSFDTSSEASEPMRKPHREVRQEEDI